MTKQNGVNNVIMQVTCFLNGLMLNMLFCNIVLYLEKVTSYEKFSKNRTLEVQMSGKFQHFNALCGSIEIVKKS